MREIRQREIASLLIDLITVKGLGYEREERGFTFVSATVMIRIKIAFALLRGMYST